MKDGRVVVDITKDAKDTTFVDSVIEGGMRNAGTGTKVIRTTISIFRKAPKEHPIIFWAAFTTIIGTLFTIVLGVVNLVQLHSEAVNKRAGDILIKAGDGGENGNGGNIYIGPGNYKAGDSTQTR